MSCKDISERKTAISKPAKEAKSLISEKRDLNPKLTDTINIPSGKIDGYLLTYDCIGCSQMESYGVKIFYSKNGKRRLLLKNLQDDGYYIDDVSMFQFNGNNFIYVGRNHTYGHHQGYLYYINPVEMKAYKVRALLTKNPEIRKILDTLEFHKIIELTKDNKNNLAGGSTYRDKSHNGYYNHYDYKIVKTGKNKFVLVPENEELSDDN